jgi:hypothetical protein
MKWFRFYHEFMDDPKVSMMSDTDQLLWVKSLCLASESAVRGVIFLSDEQIAWRLRIAKETWQSAADKFRAKGMLDHIENGYQIANWDDRQFESDSSTARVTKHRTQKRNVSETFQESACNVSETLNETPPETDTDSKADPETETETETEKVKESSAVSNVVPIPKEPYQDFADIYNRFRPPTWVGVRSIGSDRKKLTKGWIKSYGREGALERLENALRWLTAPSMQWWITKPGKFSYATLGSKDRLYEWSECWGQLQSGENVIAMPEAQVEAAAAMASGHMANAEWIARKNRELGIANA